MNKRWHPSSVMILASQLISVGHINMALAEPGYSLSVKNVCVAAGRPRPTMKDSDCDYCHKSTPRMVAYQSGKYLDVFCPAGLTPEPPPPDPIPTQPARPLNFSGSLGKFVNERQWVVTCSSRKNQLSQRYKFAIRSLSGKQLPFRIKLMVTRGDQSVSVVDPINQDKQSSEWGNLDLGDGQYLVSVSKFSPNQQMEGKLAFSVQHACESENNIQTQLKVKKQP